MLVVVGIVSSGMSSARSACVVMVWAKCERKAGTLLEKTVRALVEEDGPQVAACLLLRIIAASREEAEAGIFAVFLVVGERRVRLSWNPKMCGSSLWRRSSDRLLWSNAAAVLESCLVSKSGRRSQHSLASVLYAVGS